MKKIITLVFLSITSIVAIAQDALTIYPTHWWVNMKNPKLQLLIHGDGTGGSIVFQHRGHPHSGHAKALNIIEVIDNALQVAAMAVIDRVTVESLIPHARQFIVGWVAIAKPVWHEQINKI